MSKYLTYDYEMPGDDGDPANYWHVYTNDTVPDGIFDSPSVFTMFGPENEEMASAIKDICRAIEAAVEIAGRYKNP